MIALELIVRADEGDNGRTLGEEDLGVVEKVELAQDGSTLVRRIRADDRLRTMRSSPAIHHC